jgi:hypothetical protein
VPATDPKQRDPWEPKQDPAHDDDVKALLRLADVDRSSHYSARWRDIEKPLAPYRALVKELVTP